MQISTRVVQWLTLALMVCYSSSSVQAQSPVAPTWGWAQQATGTGTAWPYDMVVDKLGNSYVVGSFYSTLTLSPTLQLSTSAFNDSDGFLVKFTSTGAVAWARQLGSAAGFDAANGVALDADGNVYVTGAFSGQLALGGISLTTPRQATYLAKYDPQGVAQWAQQSVGPNIGDSATGHDVEVDAAGNIYITGTVGWGSVSFGGSSISPAPGSAYAHFVVKYNRSGTVQWARVDGSTMANQSYPSYLALGPAGEVYMSCSVQQAPLFANISYPSRGGIDAYVVKYDELGNRQWVQQLGGPGNDEVRLGAVDAQGSLYLPLSFSDQAGVGTTVLSSAGSSDQALIKLNSQGAPLWTRTVGGRNYDIAQQAALDAFGNVYLLGWFMDQVTPAPGLSFSSAGHYDALLLSYTSQGTLRWGTASGGLNPDDFVRMGFSQTGEARVAGRFSTTLPLGSTTLIGSTTTSNWFVASLTDNLPTLASIAALVPSSGAPGQEVTVSGTGFVGVTQVLFNGSPAARFAVQSATQLRATVPQGATAGPVQVQTLAGTTASVTLFQPSVLTSITPTETATVLAWPNPVAPGQVLQVQLPMAASGARVEVRNLLGQVVRQKPFDGRNTTLSLQSLPPGVYQLTVQRPSQPALQQRIVLGN
ncbi:SBBP repeat-containing protein [Hymenobacter mucosus]|uniref:Por secretion system C-terminal sorting domain-containing protein n=1 Tax=Hymenobacter mucosus TaxID=1411120 RepID=A0A238VIX8_9BACT|nr:SBBP repeat-containing protein [Hymenobacter mucosus]SNR34148.1 Por secretion system C-terminal sorting domain-containing protein [Hymenobacter mucosus]